MKTRGNKRALWGVAAVALLATAVLAEQVTVKRNIVDILRGKGSLYYPPLKTVKNGDTLEVLGHEGRWLKVRSGDVEGYVLEASLTGQAVGQTADPGATAGGSTEATDSAAAKGWDAVQWANSHGKSLDGLNTMVDTRKRLARDPQRFEQFKSDGHVGVQ
jgi:uncharacterized protein YgiM (DUF1202 family)